MNISISIITINFNNLAGLKLTMESVNAQLFNGYEYIIIDGGSTDGSKEFIENNAGNLKYWVSEKDNGVYHAMNKGIKVATGEFVLFLNSGDLFYTPKSLELLYLNHNQFKIVYGNILVRNKELDYIKDYPSSLDFSYFIKDTLPHPATLISKSLFDKVGYYNEEFKIVADWEFFMKVICLHNSSYIHVDETISVFNTDGISSNPANNSITNKEKETVLNAGYSTFIRDYKKLEDCQKKLQQIQGSRIYRLLNKLSIFH